MSCEPEIIEQYPVTNELIAYRFVCCGEICGPDCQPDRHQCEDTRITLHLDVDHDARIAEYRAEVAARHEKMKAWRGKNGK